MKNALRNYIKDQNGAEEITVVVLTVAGLGVAIGVGWWIFNIVKKNAKNNNCQGGNPFCVE